MSTPTDEIERLRRATVEDLRRERERLEREARRAHRALDGRAVSWPLLMIAAAVVGLVLVLALGGCVNVTVALPPSVEPTPAPPACVTLELVDLQRTAAGETVRLRATNPGGPAVVLELADLALVDTAGEEYRAAGQGARELRPGQAVPVELSARPAEGWLTTARLHQADCPPVLVPLPEPR